MPAKQETKLDFYAKLAVEHSTDSIVVCDVDGKFEWVNPAFRRMTGYTLEEVKGETPGRILQGPETSPRTVAEIRKAISERRPIRTEIYNYTKAGDGYWIDLSITPVFDPKGQQTHFMAIERDITERRHLEDQAEEVKVSEDLRKSERKLLAQTSEWLYAVKSIDELLLVVRRSMETMMPEASGQLYLYSNSRDTLDLAAHWGDAEVQKHVHPDDCWALRRGRAYAFGRSQLEFPCAHVSDPESPYFCLPIIAHGDTIGLLHLSFTGFKSGAGREVTFDHLIEQRWETALICSEQISLAIANVRLRMELKEQSIRDQLTGLWNRRWLLETAPALLTQAARNETPMSVISIDVDHFKRFNDVHGHDAGDIVLREVGRVMNSTFAQNIHPCRVGGEEFLFLCADTDETAAEEVAEAFRQEISRAVVPYAGVTLPAISVSQGIAVAPRDGKDILDLMKAADQALYAAKDRGRNCVVSYNGLSSEEIGPQRTRASA
ncbi:MAG: diguanylate cyclase [Pseudomonadota bacterium]